MLFGQQQWDNNRQLVNDVQNYGLMVCWTYLMDTLVVDGITR